MTKKAAAGPPCKGGPANIKRQITVAKHKVVVLSPPNNLENRQVAELRRRNTDEQTDRAMKLKLGMFSATQLQLNLNSLGQNVAQVVSKEIRRVRPLRRHIPSSFWESIIKHFNFTGTLTEGLVPPQHEEAVSKELDGALKLAHHPNPASKIPVRLLRFLDAEINAMNRTELYGLLRGSFESPSLSRTMSRQMLEGVINT